MSFLEQQNAELKAAVERLGHRIEPNESRFHIKKISSMEEFKQNEERLDEEEEFKLTVNTCFVQL